MAINVVQSTAVQAMKPVEVNVPEAREMKKLVQEMATKPEVQRPVDPAVKTERFEYESSVGANSLRYRIRDEQVEGLIINPEGDIVKTIPTSDLLDIMRQNAIPTLGNFLSVKT